MLDREVDDKECEDRMYGRTTKEHEDDVEEDLLRIP